VLLAAVALVAGLALLVKAADAFVLGASRISLMLRVSPVVVGAVVLGFGTSAPELLVSGLAATQGSPAIAAGNVVGSNVANVTLVAGVGALVAGRLAVSSGILRREAPLAALAVAAFALVLQLGMTRWLGVALLAAFAATMAWIVAASFREDDPLGREAERELGAPADTSRRREAVRTGLGLLGTAAGAQLVVLGARGLADGLGIDEGFVGLTVVAVGTSLPEVVTSVQGARRGESHLVVGNVLGSNIFNSLAIGGTIALIAPGPLAGPVIGLGSAAMVAAGLVAWYLMGTRRELVRWEAAVLLAAYAALLPFLAR
jgi:cation:H+ antiporter